MCNRKLNIRIVLIQKDIILRRFDDHERRRNLSLNSRKRSFHHQESKEIIFFTKREIMKQYITAERANDKYGQPTGKI